MTFLQRLGMMFARFYPLYKGRGRLALIRVASARSNDLIKARLRTGEGVYVYRKDYIGQMVLLYGDLDPSVSQFIMNNINSGDTVVDIGANLGVISVPAAKKVGAGGMVVAVEPNPMCTEALLKSKKLNRIGCLEVRNIAISSYAGKAWLDVPAESYGRAKITMENNENRIFCNVSTLNKLIIEMNVCHIRLLKIDVEGHEYEVLLGGSDLLQAGMVDIIVFESHQREEAFENRREVRLLACHGFSIYEIQKSLGLKVKLIKAHNEYLPIGSEFAAINNKLFLKRNGCVARRALNA